MFRNTFLKTLRDMRVSLAWWAAGSLLLCLWMVSLFPDITADPAALLEYAESFPEEFTALFAIEDLEAVTTLSGYLSLYLFSFFLPALTIAFGVALGAGLIRQEEDSGTLDLLLANPIPRWRVVTEKALALLTFCALVLGACLAGLLLGAAVAGLDVGDVHVAEGVLSLLGLTLWFSSVALGLTTLGVEKGVGVGVAAGLAVVTYIVAQVQALAGLPEWTQRLSPWFYYNIDGVLKRGLHWGYLALLLAVAGLLVALGTWRFSQRDLGT